MSVEYTTDEQYPPLSDEEMALLEKARKQIPRERDALPVPSAEDIANTVEDLRQGRVLWHKDRRLADMCHARVKDVKTIVDATAIYDDLISDQKLGTASISMRITRQ